MKWQHFETSLSGWPQEKRQGKPDCGTLDIGQEEDCQGHDNPQRREAAEPNAREEASVDRQNEGSPVDQVQKVAVLDDKK